MAKHPYEDFLANPQTMEFTAEFSAFYQAVADAGCENYDCNQVARAIKEGWTPERAAAAFTADAEQDRLGEDPESLLDHDYSMNG